MEKLNQLPNSDIAGITNKIAREALEKYFPRLKITLKLKINFFICRYSRHSPEFPEFQ
jgi:hypothetical protein